LSPHDVRFRVAGPSARISGRRAAAYSELPPREWGLDAPGKFVTSLLPVIGG